MAYSTENPPTLMIGGIGGGPQQWSYSSADPHGTVDTVGYFTDGLERGMKEGDIMFVKDTNVGTLTTHSVISAVSIAAAT